MFAFSPNPRRASASLDPRTHRRSLRSLGCVAALFLVLAAPSVRADDGSSGWEILRSESGIQTARKSVPGSPFVAFRGEGDVPAPVLAVADVLVDVSRGNQWMDSIKEVRMLRKVSDSDYVLYSHIGTPPMLTDREFVYSVHVTMAPDGTMFRIDMRSVDDPLAPHTSFVRGNLTDGTFVLQASPDHRSTHVVAEMHADPMGNIPAFLMNAFQKNWGYNTIQGLRKQVAAGRSPVHPLLAGHLVSDAAP